MFMLTSVYVFASIHPVLYMFHCHTPPGLPAVFDNSFLAADESNLDIIVNAEGLRVDERPSDNSLHGLGGRLHEALYLA